MMAHTNSTRNDHLSVNAAAAANENDNSIAPHNLVYSRLFQEKMFASESEEILLLQTHFESMVDMLKLALDRDIQHLYDGVCSDLGGVVASSAGGGAHDGGGVGAGGPSSDGPSSISASFAAGGAVVPTATPPPPSSAATTFNLSDGGQWERYLKPNKLLLTDLLKASTFGGGGGGGPFPSMAGDGSVAPTAAAGAGTVGGGGVNSGSNGMLLEGPFAFSHLMKRYAEAVLLPTFDFRCDDLLESTTMVYRRVAHQNHHNHQQNQQQMQQESHGGSVTTKARGGSSSTKKKGGGRGDKADQHHKVASSSANHRLDDHPSNNAKFQLQTTRSTTSSGRKDGNRGGPRHRSPHSQGRSSRRSLSSSRRRTFGPDEYNDDEGDFYTGGAAASAGRRVSAMDFDLVSAPSNDAYHHNTTTNDADGKNDNNITNSMISSSFVTKRVDSRRSMSVSDGDGEDSSRSSDSSSGTDFSTDEVPFGQATMAVDPTPLTSVAGGPSHAVTGGSHHHHHDRHSNHHHDENRGGFHMGIGGGRGGTMQQQQRLHDLQLRASFRSRIASALKQLTAMRAVNQEMNTRLEQLRVRRQREAQQFAVRAQRWGMQLDSIHKKNAAMRSSIEKDILDSSSFCDYIVEALRPLRKFFLIADRTRKAIDETATTTTNAVGGTASAATVGDATADVSPPSPTSTAATNISAAAQQQQPAEEVAGPTSPIALQLPMEFGQMTLDDEPSSDQPLRNTVDASTQHSLPLPMPSSEQSVAVSGVLDVLDDLLFKVHVSKLEIVEAERSYRALTKRIDSSPSLSSSIRQMKGGVGGGPFAQWEKNQRQIELLFGGHKPASLSAFDLAHGTATKGGLNGMGGSPSHSLRSTSPAGMMMMQQRRRGTSSAATTAVDAAGDSDGRSHLLKSPQGDDLVLMLSAAAGAVNAPSAGTFGGTPPHQRAGSTSVSPKVNFSSSSLLLSTGMGLLSNTASSSVGGGASPSKEDIQRLARELAKETFKAQRSAAAGDGRRSEGQPQHLGPSTLAGVSSRNGSVSNANTATTGTAASATNTTMATAEEKERLLLKQHQQYLQHQQEQQQQQRIEYKEREVALRRREEVAAEERYWAMRRQEAEEKAATNNSNVTIHTVRPAAATNAVAANNRRRSDAAATVTVASATFIDPFDALFEDERTSAAITDADEGSDDDNGTHYSMGFPAAAAAAGSSQRNNNRTPSRPRSAANSQSPSQPSLISSFHKHQQQQFGPIDGGGGDDNNRDTTATRAEEALDLGTPLPKTNTAGAAAAGGAASNVLLAPLYSYSIASPNDTLNEKLQRLRERREAMRLRSAGGGGGDTVFRAPSLEALASEFADEAPFNFSAAPQIGRRPLASAAATVRGGNVMENTAAAHAAAPADNTKRVGQLDVIQQHMYAADDDGDFSQHGTDGGSAATATKKSAAFEAAVEDEFNRLTTEHLRKERRGLEDYYLLSSDDATHDGNNHGTDYGSSSNNVGGGRPSAAAENKKRSISQVSATGGGPIMTIATSHLKAFNQDGVFDGIISAKASGGGGASIILPPYAPTPPPAPEEEEDPVAAVLRLRTSHYGQQRQQYAANSRANASGARAVSPPMASDGATTMAPTMRAVADAARRAKADAASNVASFVLEGYGVRNSGGSSPRRHQKMPSSLSSAGGLLFDSSRHSHATTPPRIARHQQTPEDVYASTVPSPSAAAARQYFASKSVSEINPNSHSHSALMARAANNSRVSPPPVPSRNRSPFITRGDAVGADPSSVSPRRQQQQQQPSRTSTPPSTIAGGGGRGSVVGGSARSSPSRIAFADEVRRRMAALRQQTASTVAELRRGGGY